MTARELREKFITFFEDKGHKRIPSAPLVLENDPSTLFISAGIQPLVPYFLGKKHPQGTRLANVQKCVRTGDIEEVGDACHHTFFEMLGNWSLGDYFKNEMIPWSLELLTKQFGYNSRHLHVTCFAGDANAPKDDISANLWRSLGIPEDRVHFLPKKDNWWGPPGLTGPCGPDSEMFIDVFPSQPDTDFVQGCQSGRYLEIGNDVFIQYLKNSEGKFEKLLQDNVDTGYGVERNLAVVNGLTDDYLTEIWQPIIQSIESISQKKYQLNQRSMRIIADHLRSAVFIISDGVQPSNKEAGYVLRRLIRMAVRQGKEIGINNAFCGPVAEVVINNRDNYAGDYPELGINKQNIITIISEEERKFAKTLDRGLKEIEEFKNTSYKALNLADSSALNELGEKAFYYYETYGTPPEMFIDELKKNQPALDSKTIMSSFARYKVAHSDRSKTLSAGRFKSGLSDSSETVTKYHTATHLFHQALRLVLGEHVHQAGSNITNERLRFDFTHSDKMTSEEIRKVEEIVNKKIRQDLPVVREEKDKDQALAEGALAFFPEKYPQLVSVYAIGAKDELFSQELCAGPHVVRTGEIGQVKITKEESCGTGVRRIYAQLTAA